MSEKLIGRCLICLQKPCQCKKPCDTIEQKENEEVKECCDKCKNSKYALKGKMKEKFGGICGLTCECHNKSTQEEVISSQTPTPNDWIEDWEKFTLEVLLPERVGYLRFKVKELIEKALTQQKEAIEKEWRERIEKKMKEIHDLEDNPELAVRLQAELLAIINNYPKIKE